jgi:pimeloyl-ACP methyl ester carboxylesterase
VGTVLGSNHGGPASAPAVRDAELLVLLHGLGGTGDVWVPGLEDHDERWRGWWWAPDLAGHGATGARLDRYTFGALAEDLAGRLPEALSYVVVGHSLGGVVGLELARLVPAVRRVVGLGIKVEWSDDELAWARALSERPVAWFDTEAEAVARHRKVSGLGGLVDDDVARMGVVEQGGRWRLALDPRAFAVGRPDMTGLLAECPAEVVLARGESDHMVSEAQLLALVPAPVTLTGLGHNAHLEDPAAVLRLV